MELRIDISQKQIMTQHMIQSMEILQMSAQELEGYIEKIALENPVIELDERRSSDAENARDELWRKLDWLESTDLQNKVYYQADRTAEHAENNWHNATDLEETLHDYLMSQILLSDFSEEDFAILEFMILSLDGKGYYTDELSVAAEHFDTEVSHIEKLLAVIQSLDPAGVGARNLKECLLLQLKRNPDASPLACMLAEGYLTGIAKNHLPDIAKKLGVTVDEIRDACDEIRTLNPKPGSSFSSREQLRYISPDAIVVKLADQFEILVNEYQYPGFTISGYYQNLLKETDDKETKKYLQEKIQQAQWISGCITQRTSTLSRVMHELVRLQNDFFLYGIGHKRPMKLSDLATRLDLHESTISRTLRSKYLQCSWGVFPLNYFLTSTVSKSRDSDEAFTPEQVKAQIQSIIDNEDKKKPLSDQAISNLLAEKNIHISRRTVNKYRTEMELPDKGGRKSW